ncbi:MAG: SRPBCC domain-containing protein [Sphingobacteriaceae bacterium]|jgi:uncharacterized protein YndB with AHSA1/START domain
MLLDLSVSKSININASVHQVWKALTDPAIIKIYLYGTNTLTDWKIGSDIIFEGEYEGHKYRDHGFIKENINGEKISYSYWSGFSGLEDKPENYSTVTYELVSISDNETKLTWIQKGYASEQNHQHSEKGMDAFLQQLKQTVENLKQ